MNFIWGFEISGGYPDHQKEREEIKKWFEETNDIKEVVEKFNEKHNYKPSPTMITC